MPAADRTGDAARSPSDTAPPAATSEVAGRSTRSSEEPVASRAGPSSTATTSSASAASSAATTIAARPPSTATGTRRRSPGRAAAAARLPARHDRLAGRAPGEAGAPAETAAAPVLALSAYAGAGSWPQRPGYTAADQRNSGPCRLAGHLDPIRVRRQLLTSTPAKGRIEVAASTSTAKGTLRRPGERSGRFDPSTLKIETAGRRRRLRRAGRALRSHLRVGIYHDAVDRKHDRVVRARCSWTCDNVERESTP